MALAPITDMYWSGTPGVYGSNRAGFVTTPATDAAYQVWLTTYGQPQIWPRDTTGAQTDASLDQVFEAAGLPPITAAVTTKAQLQAAVWAQSQTLLSNSRLYLVAGVTMPSGVTGISCDALSSSANLEGVNIWGMANPTATQAWTDNAYNVFILTGAQAVAFAQSVLAYGQSVYAELATVVTAVNSGSITTLAQIASAAWPT